LEKKICLIFHLSLLTLFLPTWAQQEFIYPIAEINDDMIMMVHQKSYDDLELLLWDRHEGIACRELTSMFIPSCVQLLPGKKAFSFIDRGRIRIKTFNKRAPRAIDIYEPIYAIFSMKWITDEQFYFAGKNYGKLSIFLCDTSNRGAAVYSLTNRDGFDYVYPCKVGNNLFCVSRDQLQNYAIQKLEWSPRQYESAESLAPISQQLLVTHDKPLCFLCMEDESSGFVVECLAYEQSSEFLNFSCCALNCINDSWSLAKLFEFKIPSKFLIGTDEDRVYETIAPFVPRYTQEWIYYVSYDDESENCTIQRYNRALSSTEYLTDTSRSIAGLSHVFAPLIIKDMLYCGYLFSEKTPSAFRGFPQKFMHVDPVTGIIQCRLPQVSLKATDHDYEGIG
jgi:hypothetical protein